MSVNPRDQSVARQTRAAEGRPVPSAGSPDEGRYGYASSFGWAAGFALVVLGIMFALQVIGEPVALRNPWALAFAIPVVVAAGSAWMLYRQVEKTLTRAAASALTTSFVLAAAGVILALDLPWQHTWPILMIAVGMSALAQAMVPLRDAVA